MHGSPQSDDPLRSAQSSHSVPGADSAPPDQEPGKRSTLEEPELEAALQLLVERAQYITGATGTALALPQGEEMVCRASAGFCAPAVGARLQVRSGLTGESIARRQLLRCDNAEADPRVNLETCQALGIASIVVLPLLRCNGEVRGLFELFSDHAYAFEERDLIALERMADLTQTALDLAEQRYGSVPPRSPARVSEKGPEQALPTVTPPVPSPAAGNGQRGTATVAPAEPVLTAPAPAKPTPSELIPPQSANPEPIPMPAEPALSQSPQASVIDPVPEVESLPPEAVSIPEAMRRVQKCVSCGFPVSQGRTLCLDCERKENQKQQSEKKAGASQSEAPAAVPNSAGAESSVGSSTAMTPNEVLPPFLANSAPVEESWLANHVNLLAVLVLIVGIVLAVVVFR